MSALPFAGRTRSIGSVGRWAAAFAVCLLLSPAVRGQVFTEFPVTTAAAGPGGLVAGPDGNLWFTEEDVNKVGRITTSGTVTEFPIGGGDSDPVTIVLGSDGKLWFTMFLTNQIGNIDPLAADPGATIGTFTIPVPSSGPLHMTPGPDNALWFTESSANRIGRLSTSLTYTDFAIPTAGSGPDDITVGPDNNLWFVEASGNKIARITLAGVITEFPLPRANSHPQGITTGSDGNLWFGEVNTNRIGRMTTSGVVTEFLIRTADSRPEHPRLMPDGNVWVAYRGSSRIARVTPSGTITEFPIPTAISQPLNLAAGPDGNLWITEFAGNKIARLDLTTQILTISPSSGPAAGGTGFTLSGIGFVTGAGIKIGGIDATNALVVGPTSATGDSPALPPGTLNDVRLTNTGGTVGLLPKGWLSDFSDVPQSHSFHASIERIFRAGITSGCGGGKYCPSDPVTRAQMAVFILKGEHGAGYQPPAATGTVFDDVSTDSFGASFIEQMKAEGITQGCGGNNYCPNNSVTRGQMAVFLIKAEHGSSFSPPPPVGVFDDVPTNHPFAKWIEQLNAEGITSGCGGNNFCPGEAVTRDQMAKFLVRTFRLP